MEYESIPCAIGHNRLCNSCKVCSFLDDNDIGKKICLKDPYYYSWYQNNCCLNEIGKVVSDVITIINLLNNFHHAANKLIFILVRNYYFECNSEY